MGQQEPKMDRETNRTGHKVVVWSKRKKLDGNVTALMALSIKEMRRSPDSAWVAQNVNKAAEHSLEMP